MCSLVIDIYGQFRYFSECVSKYFHRRLSSFHVTNDSMTVLTVTVIIYSCLFVTLALTDKVQGYYLSKARNKKKKMIVVDCLENIIINLWQLRKT
jgi:hypothetical protein